MRRIVTYLWVLGVAGGIILVSYFGTFDSKITVDNRQATSTTETKQEPQYPKEWLEEAEAAKEAVLHRKTIEAEKEKLQKEINEREARIDEIDKELGLY